MDAYEEHKFIQWRHTRYMHLQWDITQWFSTLRSDITSVDDVLDMQVPMYASYAINHNNRIIYGSPAKYITTYVINDWNRALDDCMYVRTISNMPIHRNGFIDFLRTIYEYDTIDVPRVDLLPDTDEYIDIGSLNEYDRHEFTHKAGYMEAYKLDTDGKYYLVLGNCMHYAFSKAAVDSYGACDEIRYTTPIGRTADTIWFSPTRTNYNSAHYIVPIRLYEYVLKSGYRDDDPDDYIVCDAMINYNDSPIGMTYDYSDYRSSYKNDIGYNDDPNAYNLIYSRPTMRTNNSLANELIATSYDDMMNMEEYESDYSTSVESEPSSDLPSISDETGDI